MVQLTRQQGQVGRVLQEGNLLISERGVTSEEEQEVRLQMTLLNERWEQVRVNAMNKQSRSGLIPLLKNTAHSYSCYLFFLH